MTMDQEVIQRQVSLLIESVDAQDLTKAITHLGMASQLEGLQISIVIADEDPNEISIANGEYGFGYNMETGSMYHIGG